MTNDIRNQAELLYNTINILSWSVFILHRANGGSFDIRKFVSDATKDAKDEIVNELTLLYRDKVYIQTLLNGFDRRIYEIDYYLTHLLLILFVASYAWGYVDLKINNDFYSAKCDYIFSLIIFFPMIFQHLNKDMLLARTKYKTFWNLHKQVRYINEQL